MLNLSEENKALCFSDSVLKPLYIFLYFWQDEDPEGLPHWQYFKTIDDAIVLESMSIEEGILEGNTFELGSFIVPTIKVKWRNDGIIYKDMVAVPVQKIGTQYIAYFDGYISSEEIEDNGQTVSAEIVSFLGERLNIDVLGTVKAYNGGTFYEMVQNALAQTAGIWIKGSETGELLKKFPNADKIITLDENTLPKTLTVSELLKQSGEFLGSHIISKEKRIVNIDEMTNYVPTGNPIIEFIRISNIDYVAKSQLESLPSAYKRLPYIESSGLQYIDTNIFPDDATKIQIKIAMNEYSAGVIVGYRNNESDAFRLFNYNGNTYLDYGSGDGYNRLIGDNTYDGRINKGIIYDLEIGNRYVKDLDTGRNKVQGSPVSFDEKTFSIQVFDNGVSSGKVFYCKIYKSNTIVADLVPCVRVTDNNVGMYDLVRNEFFANQGSGSFIAPNPIETHTLPYHINMFSDKTNSLKFDALNVSTEVGEQCLYTNFWSEGVYNAYEIKNNIFFNALSAQSSNKCFEAIIDVASYVANQNFYHAEIKCIYPLFIEGGDYLIVNNNKHQSKLPTGYLGVESIEIPQLYFLDTEVFPDSNDIQVDFTFSYFGDNQVRQILRSDGRKQSNDTFNICMIDNKLIAQIGYYGGTIQIDTFEIPFVPPKQKINLVIECKEGQYSYSGTFQGNGYLSWGSAINTRRTMEIGNGIKLYHFSYSQNGEKLCDFYPCIRESDQKIGMYDIVNNYFTYPYSNEYGTPIIRCESSDVIIPVLSINSQGIHSMKADILCKAVNSNNK